jgi:hypothetical protein
MKKTVVFLAFLVLFVVGIMLITLLRELHWYPMPSVVPAPVSLKWNQKTFEIKDCITLFSHQPIDDFINSLKTIYDDVFFKRHPELYFGEDCEFSVEITILKNSSLMMPDGFDPDSEYYKFDMYSYKKGYIRANYQVGVLRSMDTLGQLFQYDRQHLLIHALPVRIEDQPRYGYRGLMLDLSRHFIPLTVLKKIINGLRMSKINVLHLHLHDDASMPLEMPSFPDMIDFTTFTRDERYLVADIMHLVDYAYDRGITVIPELSMPGEIGALRNYEPLKEILT